MRIYLTIRYVTMSKVCLSYTYYIVTSTARKFSIGKTILEFVLFLLSLIHALSLFAEIDLRFT